MEPIRPVLAIPHLIVVSVLVAAAVIVAVIWVFVLSDLTRHMSGDV